jgi:hypothetical protein
MDLQTRPHVGKISRSPSQFSVSGEEFSLDPNLTRNGDPTGIPVPNITKEFPLYLIPDPNPMGNPYPIPDPNPTVLEPGLLSCSIFY